MTGKTYPFVPKTTSGVRPGDFWAIPLRRGGWFASGRVLWLGSSRVELAVGLMDWCEPIPPTAQAIANRKILTYGRVHIKCIELTGGPIIGNCPLEGDAGWRELQSRPDFRRGMGEEVWGFMEIEARAHNIFGRHFPDVEGIAAERPPALEQERR